MKFWLFLSILYPIGSSEKPYCPLRDTTYTLEIRISERLAVVDRVDNWRECAKICYGLFHPDRCTHWTYATESANLNRPKKRCDLLRFPEGIPDYKIYQESGYISGDVEAIFMVQCSWWMSWMKRIMQINEIKWHVNNYDYHLQHFLT